MSDIKRILRSEKGEATYISSVIYIFIAVIIIAFILNLFGIITAKRQLDHCADQMVKQIQLAGGINQDTEELFDYLCGQMGGVTDVTYEIEANYYTPKPPGMTNAVQLGTPFYITVTGRAKLGGFWNISAVNITIAARGAGVSEHYWK